MQPVTIRRVDKSEAGELRGTLALAFSADPCTRYLWPRPAAFVDGYPRLVAAIGGANLERGTAFAADDFSTASLWIQPGGKPDSEAIDMLIGETVAPERQAVAAKVGELMDAFHPDEPHWYLSMIGVDPARQGRGLGSAMLRHTLALCDADGLAAYLESSNPKNISLYERHGFEVLGQIQPDDFPGLTPMLRRPRA
jgi:ribosomal protein S18 acetylase RimI-like enzyme